MSKPKRSSAQIPNDYQALEPKNLLATFNGTAGDDVVIVRFVDDIPTEVEINGVVETNPHQRAHLALGLSLIHI